MLKHVIAEVSREIPRQVCAKSKISGSCLILAWHEYIKIAEARRISRKLCNMKEQCKCRTAQTWKERSKWKAEWCRNQVRSLYFIWAIAESLQSGTTVARSFWAQSRQEHVVVPCLSRAIQVSSSMMETWKEDAFWKSSCSGSIFNFGPLSFLQKYAITRRSVLPNLGLQGGGITMTPKTSDLVVVSPQAGNCYDMAAPWIQHLMHGDGFMVVEFCKTKIENWLM